MFWMSNLLPLPVSRSLRPFFEWQLGLYNTMLPGFLPPIKISVEVPLCIVEHQPSSARIVLVFRERCREFP